jgi:hypothetical protein
MCSNRESRSKVISFKMKSELGKRCAARRMMTAGRQTMEDWPVREKIVYRIRCTASCCGGNRAGGTDPQHSGTVSAALNRIKLLLFV